MAALISPNEVQKWIELALAEQPNIGIIRAVMNIVLEAPSSFDPLARRKPRAGFVLGAVLFAAAAVCFCYFNCAF